MVTGHGKKRLLFVFKSVPYPLRADGISVRYLPIIEAVSRGSAIDLFVIDGRAEKESLLEGLKPYCRKIVHLKNPRRTRHGIFTKCMTYLKFLLPWTPPLSVVRHGGGAVTRGIIDAARGEHYDTVVLVGGELLPDLMNALASISAGKVFVDFIDSPYLWAVRKKDELFGIGMLNRYERWKTRRWEADVIRKADGTIYISRVDADAIPSGDAPTTKRHIVPNGINLPDRKDTKRAALPSPNIGFLGTMGYHPNIEAVEWLYREVFTALRETIPGLTLVVIGRYPSPSIRELGKHPGVIVTGEVEDIWEYVNAVDIFLFPLLRGAGLKNKILEAMYAGRPVVTTEIGNEGIDAVPGSQIVLGRTPEDFRRETARLLGSPEERARMGKAAHAFVTEKFSWDRILSAYGNLLLGDVP
ncbi:MAG: glycosyltransferase family 4 protein [Deltaproteobacteria bacterium]